MTNLASFPSAEAAWLWTMAAIEARHNPAAKPPGPGPCRPEDVVKCLDELYRNRRIELIHARALRHWGIRGRAPDSRVDREWRDAELWKEAIGRLDFFLRRRGIVADPVAQEREATLG